MPLDSIYISIVGTGKMSKSIQQNLPKNYKIVNIFDSKNQVDLQKLLISKSEIVVDCSIGEVFLKNLEAYLDSNQKILAVASNWYHELFKVKEKVAQKNGCLLYSDNFSIANFYYKKIIQKTCQLFNNQEDYDLALIEEHHVFKKDYPSAVAKEIAKIVLKEVGRKEIFSPEPVQLADPKVFYSSSLRHGKNTIKHNFCITGEFDEIEITHNVRDRKAFTTGVLKGLNFLAEKKIGVFDMNDLVKSFNLES
jgi:4-hydroxy-tetrahydrodipicolinate reductase